MKDEWTCNYCRDKDSKEWSLIEGKLYCSMCAVKLNRIKINELIREIKNE